MRIGLGGGGGSGGGFRPHPKATGYALVAFGIIIVLLEMPLSFYVAVMGGMVAYVGYTLLYK